MQKKLLLLFVLFVGGMVSYSFYVAADYDDPAVNTTEVCERCAQLYVDDPSAYAIDEECQAYESTCTAVQNLINSLALTHSQHSGGGVIIIRGKGGKAQDGGNKKPIFVIPIDDDVIVDVGTVLGPTINGGRGGTVRSAVNIKTQSGKVVYNSLKTKNVTSFTLNPKGLLSQKPETSPIIQQLPADHGGYIDFPLDINIPVKTKVQGVMNIRVQVKGKNGEFKTLDELQVPVMMVSKEVFEKMK